MENQALTIVEGLLFIVGDEGLTLTQCAAVLDVSESEAQLILEDLQRLYADDQRGIEVVDYGGVFKFVSKAAIHPYAQKLFANAKIPHCPNPRWKRWRSLPISSRSRGWKLKKSAAWAAI